MCVLPITLTDDENYRIFLKFICVVLLVFSMYSANNVEILRKAYNEVYFAYSTKKDEKYNIVLYQVSLRLYGCRAMFFV